MHRYTVISHTADTGVEATADSLSELIGHLAFAMFDLMYDIDTLPSGTPTSFEVAAANPVELAVDVLGELLFLSEADDVAFRDIEVKATRSEAVVAADACPTPGTQLEGPPIKAVTYHDIAVEQQPDGTWFGRIIFDV